MADTHIGRGIRSAIAQGLAPAGDPDSPVALDQTMDSQVRDAIRNPLMSPALVVIASHGVMLSAERGES